MTTIVGIDPGQTGAVAAITHDGQLLWVEDMPDGLSGVAVGAWLAELLRHEATLAVVEQVGAMPGNGSVSMFKFGTSYGSILGALGALAVPTILVRPAVWKRRLGLTSDKNASRQRATERWPEMADLFRRVKDDGRAEAALIALYGKEAA